MFYRVALDFIGAWIIFCQNLFENSFFLYILVFMWERVQSTTITTTLVNVRSSISRDHFNLTHSKKGTESKWMTLFSLPASETLSLINQA